MSPRVSVPPVTPMVRVPQVLHAPGVGVVGAADCEGVAGGVTVDGGVCDVDGRWWCRFWFRVSVCVRAVVGLFWALLARLPKSRTHTYDDLVDLLIKLALERENDSHMEKFLKRPLGRGSTLTPEHGEGKGPKNPTNANKGGGKGGGSNLRAMSEVKPEAAAPPLFYCKPVNDKGGPCHAPDCDHHSGCVLHLRRQQHTKDGKTVTHQDHFRWTITCGYCGKHRYYKRRMSHQTT